MKIIGKSNFDLDNVSDILICENVNQTWGIFIIKAIREITGEYDTYYPMLVEDDYKLYKWEL